MVRTPGTTGEHPAGCSKRPDFSPAQPRRAKTRRSASKAAASEEARRYVPHFVGPFALLIWILANGKAPTVFPTSEKFPFRVEPLREARTPLADFFSVLLALEVHQLL